ncbi:hypothetical protein CDO52_22515 [Nocardiopsis gilva YIM 90087]|uniref:Uncharacterized protein n=1 Tax=Nocardiopsis gilva YIM 90087 TaxID=1235441 RepID=A0A223SAS6_9ACTN|nr:hypothetical protein [Nocardiopsis gilva]ASU85195.1 hypothetical protein CDO52_22515 [Nocardiopsis gilva YIM 90087]
MSTATASVLAAGLVGAPAEASVSVDLDTDAPPTAALGPQDARARAAFSPAGCTGRTHSPHKSSVARGTVSVVADTRCRWSVPTLGVATVLYRSRWYGWEESGASGMKERRTSRSVRANAGSASCADDAHDWLGSSYHESVEGGTSFVGRTSKRRNDITC